MMSITRLLVNKVMQSHPLDHHLVTQAALNGVMDYFASSLQAHNAHEIALLLNWLTSEGGNSNAWLIGQKQSATARQAALFNGLQAHLLDYDDIHEEVRGHPSAVILSALFSSISLHQQQFELSGQRFLSAYVVGVELMPWLGKAVGDEHYTKGWHNTATLGGIAATAAICYLHRYTFIEQALAIAATQASGLRLSFGTAIKPLQVGLAAQSAIQAVEWAQLGLSAPHDFLDEEKGFLAVYGQGNQTLSLNNWGKPWSIITPGLWFKTYSYCSAASYVADAAQLLYQKKQFVINDITAIVMTFPANGDAALIYFQPQTQAQGRFSAEYIVALILLGKSLHFEAFIEQPIRDEIVELMQKMTCRYSPNTISVSSRFAIIELHTKQGDILSQYVDLPKGSPGHPYTQAELLEKLVLAIGNKVRAEQFYSLLKTLPKLSSMKVFMALANDCFVE